MMYAVTSGDLNNGQNRVRVEGRGEGRVDGIVAIDGDPTGGVRVMLDNGVACTFPNDAKLVRILGRALRQIGPWTTTNTPDEVAVSLYADGKGLAARVYVDGTWQVYAGDKWTQGRGETADDAMLQAKAALDLYGADVSVL